MRVVDLALEEQAGFASPRKLLYCRLPFRRRRDSVPNDGVRLAITATATLPEVSETRTLVACGAGLKPVAVDR